MPGRRIHRYNERTDSCALTDVSATTFDTLKFSETLREAGMPEAQAKALSHALQDQFVSELATKQDLRSAVDELRGKIRSELQSLRAEMRQLEQKLTIRLSAIVVVALGAFTTLSKLIA